MCFTENSIYRGITMKKTITAPVEYENSFLQKGMKTVCGIDEAGRGPLAGPVVAACYIFDPHNIIEGVNDSKKLSKEKRERLFEKLTAVGEYSVKFVDEKTIDEINILNATKKAMAEAVGELKRKPDVLLIDALKIDCEILQCDIVKGDLKSYSIAAASIIAKVSRDRYMTEIAKKYPVYEFEKNKGYGTAEHIKALKENGPCKIHRRTFIKNFTGNE